MEIIPTLIGNNYRKERVEEAIGNGNGEGGRMASKRAVKAAIYGGRSVRSGKDDCL